MFMKDDVALVVRRGLGQLLSFAKRSDSNLDDINEGLYLFGQELNNVSREEMGRGFWDWHLARRAETVTEIE
jgi:hypothetical protein